MQIRRDGLRSPEVAALLDVHLAHAQGASPRESMHALDLQALRSPQITFWTVWDGANLLGCGALRELDPSHGEIKSMHTAAQFRGRGVAKALLVYIIAEARSRSYSRLSLETGSMDAFGPARALYSRFGFVVCSPLAEYVVDPNSVFMTLDLTRGAP
jgi:putative acetyltransferase